MIKEKNTEESISVTLARADWRFLLSNMMPQKCIISGEGHLQSAVRMISETTSKASHNDKYNNYDLAIAVEPNYKKLHEMYKALKPGGCAYFEWNLKPILKLKSIERSLKLTGFQNINFYLPDPNPNDSATKLWIPLNAPNVISYSLNNFYKHLHFPLAKNLLDFAINRLRINPIMFFPWLLSSNPLRAIVVSIANKPPDKTNREIINLKNYGSILDVVDESQTLLSIEGEDIDNKAILFVFPKNQQEPLFVVKIPKIKRYEYLLENEGKTLRTLERSIDGIPKVLFVDNSTGLLSIGETFLHGSPLSKLITRNNFRHFAVKVTLWLINLAKETQRIDYPVMQKYHTMLSEFATSFGSLVNKEMIDKSEKALNSLNLRHSVCEHGDLAPQNILIDSKGKIGVIDWEDSNLIGLPAVDLIFFLILANFHMENAWETGKFLKVYGNIFDPSTLAGEVYEECTNLYKNEIGIEHTNLRAFHIIAFISWLHIRIRNFIEHPTDLINNTYFRLWKEELLNP